MVNVENCICPIYCCCCLFVIFGIIGIVYYEDSFDDVLHECEIYTVYTRLCQYSCRRRRRSLLMYDSSSSSSSEMHHILREETDDRISSSSTSSTCSGIQFVYKWKTMDWKYSPFRIQPDAFLDEHLYHGYFDSPFVNPDQETERKVHELIDFLNDPYYDHNMTLSQREWSRLDLRKYVEGVDQFRAQHQTNDISMFLWKLIHDHDHSEDIDVNAELVKEDPSRHLGLDCDWKIPVYSTYGDCGWWPYQHHGIGDQRTCYINDKCSKVSWYSPDENWDMARGFGYSAIGCASVPVLILLFAIGNRLWGRRGYHSF